MSLKRVLLVSFVLCYLGLLGYHHLNRSTEIEAEDILASEEFRREIPKEIASLVPTEKHVEKISPQKSGRSPFQPGSLPTHAPSNLRGEARFGYYKDLANYYGLNIRGVTVIGLRGLAPSGVRHDSEDNASMYDDTFVVLDPEQKTAVEFLGSTHAGQFVSTLVPSGVAQIKPGRYRAEPCGEYADMPCWLVTTRTGNESLPCWRDADGSGYIEADEKATQLVATEILFHNGRYEDYGSSIGCQVLPPKLMERFIQEVGVENTFDYLLIDANRRFR